MHNKFFIFILFAFMHARSHAQATCSGSLGDPIVNVTFGQGANPGAPLPVSVPGASTSYIYVAPTGSPPANIILDGDYSLVNQVPPNPGWLTTGTDHTGNTNGYMAFFNAAPTPGEFYRQTVNGLCPGTTYEFAAWILNAINSSMIPGAVPPNVTFRIYDPSNLVTPISTFSSGDVPASTTVIWHRYSNLFTTPAGLSSVIITLSNNNVGGTNLIGNDLAIDDITFRACGPLTLASFASASSISNLSVCANTAFSLYGSVSAGLNTPAYQWQISTDNGLNWTNIPGATTLTYPSAGYAAGSYQIRLVSQETANLSSPYCKFYSNVINLTVKPKSFTTTNQTICEGQSFEGHTTTGTYISTLVAANGCDSIRTLNLTVKPRSLSTINAAICEGQSYAGHTTAGTYTDTYVAANGCDSIRTLNLTVKLKSYTTNNQAICEGQSYEGHTTSGTYVSTLVAANGCDSIYTLNLIVKPRSFTTNNQSICQGQSYEGHTTSGTYVSTLVAANGCDSIYTLNLTVKPKSFTTNNQSICEGQTYEGHTTSGTYVSTLVAANGCDSIYTLNLNVKPKSLSTVNAAICQGQSYAGHTTAGTYTDTYIAANGCDSIRTLNLTIKPKSFTTNNQTICEGQSYEGHTTSGTYVSTLVAANGCDSIYTLNLIVKARSFTTNNQAICQGQSYEGHTTSGTYVSTLVAANGCDSIYTLNLVVKPRSFKTDNQTICDGQIYQGHTTSGTYVSTLVAANGCDSIYTLNLTVKPRSFTTSNISICQGQTYAGHNTSGTYISTFTAANGCDSIETLNLTVKPLPIVNTIPDTTICQVQVTTLTTIGNATSFSWTPTVQLSDPTSPSPDFTGTPGHKYYVTGFLNGCSNIDSVTVTVKTAASFIHPPEKYFCDKTSVQLDGANGNTVTYHWTGPNLSNPDIINPVVNPIYNALYDVKITDPSCNIDTTFTVFVGVLSLPDLKPKKSNDVSCITPTSKLSASGAASYSWLPAETLILANTSAPIATPNVTTTYYVTGTGNNGCVKTDSITVIKDAGEGNLYIPNTFSPNGDKKNECFHVLVKGEIQNFRFAVFDRWGVKLFESSRPEDCWDGKYKDKECPVATYVYYALGTSNCGPFIKKGTIILIR